MKFRFSLLVPLSLPLFCASVLAQEVRLASEDRDRLVRIEENWRRLLTPPTSGLMICVQT